MAAIVGFMVWIGTALKRLVDKPPKATMLGIVVAEHVQRQ